MAPAARRSTRLSRPSTYSRTTQFGPSRSARTSSIRPTRRPRALTTRRPSSRSTCALIGPRPAAWPRRARRASVRRPTRARARPVDVHRDVVGDLHHGAGGDARDARPSSEPPRPPQPARQPREPGGRADLERTHPGRFARTHLEHDPVHFPKGTALAIDQLLVEEI